MTINAALVPPKRIETAELDCVDGVDDVPVPVPVPALVLVLVTLDWALFTNAVKF